MKLVRPSEEYINSILPHVKAYMEDTSPYKTNSEKSVAEFFGRGDAEGYLRDVREKEFGKLPEGWVASTTYWLMDGDRHLGLYSVRHSLTPNLMRQGGHIAYAISPLERGKGYAVKGVELCLKELKKMGVEEALITCHAENEKSHKVIAKAINLFGGHFLETIEIDGHGEIRGFVKTID